jgi:alcohol dehydrogenase class IV
MITLLAQLDRRVEVFMEIPGLSKLRKFATSEIVFGAGARRLAGSVSSNLGASRVLVVSDPGVVQAGWTDEVIESLEQAGAACTLFTGVSPNPRSSEVEIGADAYRKNECDTIVAVGGGSVIDCAKGIGIVYSNGGDVLDYEGADLVRLPMPPLVCVPTTGGTSADVSQFAIFTSRIERRKIAIVSKSVIPDISLVDPETLITMDGYLTACTGVDALVHAIEAFVSISNSPITDINAVRAIELISQNLPATIANPLDVELRGEVMLGSLMAGLAFSNASLGANHAMSHSLGGFLDLAHGECNALTLEHVVDFNFPEAVGRFRRIAEAMGINASSLSDSACRKLLARKIHEFRIEVGITKTLGDVGVASCDIPHLAEKAMMDVCLITNPRSCKTRDIEVIYEESI